MAVLWLMVIGSAAGYAATRMMRLGSDMSMTVVLGIVGAVIGSLALSTLAAFATALSGVIGAILGAVLLIWLWRNHAQT